MSTRTETPDELDRTARQVRIPGGLTHRLAVALLVGGGNAYVTDCDRIYYAHEGAVLTTDGVDCSRCNQTAVSGRG